MRVEGKYMLGAVKEIATALAKTIEWNYGRPSFRECDFCTINIESYADCTLGEIYRDAEHWCGIKHVNTGFDSGDLTLVSDYYGGTAGSYRDIYSGEDEGDIIKNITNMMVETMNADEGADYDTIIIAKFIDEKGDIEQ